jgi:TetR/AcrR family transcriptional repressor of mexJK operon
MPGPQAGLRPSSQRKRRAILDAAELVFVRDGYDAAVVDEIAERSGVSKQTVYAHFGSKQALFVEVVVGATTTASDAVHVDVADPDSPADLPDYLERYGLRQLDVVLRPRLLGLRRLAIAEVRRFPQLGQAFWTGGPGRTMTAMRDRFAGFHDAGLLEILDPDAAARTFNWLLMGNPLNAAMLLGDAAIPDLAERQTIAEEATRVFLAAYGSATRDARRHVPTG